MALCEYSDKCFFFNEEYRGKPHSKELLCGEYCNNHFTRCARHQMAASRGIDNVPPDLQPASYKNPKCFCGM